MYILNTSFMVDYDVHELWFDTFTKRFIPFLKENGFSGLVFTKVMTNESEGHFTYSLQVNMPDLSRYNEFNEQIMGEYNTIAGPVFGDKALYFCSLLKRIEL